MRPELRPEIKKLLFKGTVIPAHPLALDANRKFDEFHQRLLTRYYAAAGAGGIAVGVHTTQFQIRDPKVNLYEKVLSVAADEVANINLNRPFIKVAGVSGPTEQAVKEALIAKKLGYDLVLVSINGLGDWSENDLLDRALEIGKYMPLFGFYLQPSVGGKVLSEKFWKDFSDISNVYAIKIAPFNRYQTLEVIRAVCGSSRNNDIAIYTGNDDNIVNDLLTTYRIRTDEGIISKEIVGGLLGHWAVWTQKAVELLNKVKKIKNGDGRMSRAMLTENMRVTDTNAAFFDAKHNFKGCIAGIHEVLRRQGLLKGIWCLDENEKLSPGQEEEIDRVYRSYPDLNDDDFVRDNIKSWMGTYDSNYRGNNRF